MRFLDLCYFMLGPVFFWGDCWNLILDLRPILVAMSVRNSLIHGVPLTTDFNHSERWSLWSVGPSNIWISFEWQAPSNSPELEKIYRQTTTICRVTTLNPSKNHRLLLLKPSCPLPLTSHTTPPCRWWCHAPGVAWCHLSWLVLLQWWDQRVRHWGWPPSPKSPRERGSCKPHVFLWGGNDEKCIFFSSLRCFFALWTLRFDNMIYIIWFIARFFLSSSFWGRIKQTSSLPQPSRGAQTSTWHQGWISVS